MADRQEFLADGICADAFKEVGIGIGFNDILYHNVKIPNV